MATILVGARGLPSLVYPAIELARRLAVAGHRVTFAGDQDREALARHHRLEFQPLEPDRFDAFLEADADTALVRRLRQRHSRLAAARQALAVDGFSAALRRDRPDLVLLNGEMHEHIIAAVGAGARVALLNTFVSIWRQPGLPPPHHIARPGCGWRGSRVGSSLLWNRLRWRKRRRRWKEAFRHAGCDRVSVLHSLGRNFGMDISVDVDAGQWLIPFTWRRLPALSLHALEFEFPHKPPAHVHYVGPMILDARFDPPLPECDRTRLAALLDARRAPGSSRRLLYAGFGSAFSTDATFLRRLAAIVAGRPDWDLVISLSGRLQASALDPVPERVHLFPWVPQMELLAAADAAITHGGINTVDECVISGVPLLVYNGRETDMPGTTSRVVHHGIGIAGDRLRDDPDTIRGHIDRLLHEGGVRTRIERLQRAYAAYVQDRVAEHLVESILARPATTAE